MTKYFFASIFAIIGGYIGFIIGPGIFVGVIIGMIIGLILANFLGEHTDIDFVEEYQYVKIPKKNKISFDDLTNYDDLEGKRIYDSSNQKYLGKILGVDSQVKTCQIKSDFGKEFTKPFSDILIEDSLDKDQQDES